jgi:hypothetical protein
MTMANGVSFTSLQISQLPDDPEKPMYLFDSDHWDKAPKVLVMEMDENISHPTRHSKNDKYRDNGSALMWNRYVAFGYYHTKNVYDFIRELHESTGKLADGKNLTTCDDIISLKLKTLKIPILQV